MRDYDYIPRPLVEDHYHIRELIEAQEKRALDREIHRKRAKTQEERESDIKTAKIKETKMFYCERCKKDFVAEAIKQVESDWTNTNQRIAFYKTKCFCGTWSIRHITDIYKDSYFLRSRKVRQDQGSHFADMIQPFQTNYELLYSKKRV